MDLARLHLEWLLKRHRVIHINGCWTNPGNPAHYVKIRLAGKAFSIHRISAYLYLGLDINNETIQVNHKIECLYPGCWNPEHLYLGNQSDNLYDQVKKGSHHNANKTHCNRGHKYDQFKYKNGRATSRRCSQCRKIYG